MATIYKSRNWIYLLDLVTKELEAIIYKSRNWIYLLDKKSGDYLPKNLQK